jgi:hypothetical protein
MKANVCQHFATVVAFVAALGIGSACSSGDTTSNGQGGAGGSSGGGGSDSGSAATISFATAVYPILKANCVGCHGAGNPIDMSVSASDALGRLVDKPAPAGFVCASSSEKLIVPGNSAMSLLFSKVSSAMPVCGARMPLGGMLSAADQTTIKDWIDDGAQP